MTATNIGIDTQSRISSRGETAASRRKPLYLLVSYRIEIRAAGASIAIYRDSVPAGRYPLNRLSRVVVTQQVDWHGGALTLCFNSGIPIVVINARGNLIGSCIPARVRASPLSELLDEFTIDSRWPISYENFLRHTRSRLLRSWAADCVVAEHPLTDAEWNSWVRAFVQTGEPPEEAAFDCRGLLRSIIERQLHSASVCTHYWGDAGAHLDLGQDFANILYGRLIMYAGSLFLRVDSQAAAIRLFESDTFGHEQYVTRLLVSLQRFLLRTMSRWQ